MRNASGWEAGETRELLRTRIFRVVEQSFRTPGGQWVSRQTVVHPGAVAIMPFLSERDVILVRQFRPSAGTTMIEVPAGTLEGGEAPEVCARRELEEETGFRAGRMESLGKLRSCPGFCSETLYLFRASDLSKVEAAGDEDEFVERLIVPFREALEMCLDGRIEDSKTLAIFLRCILRDGRLPL
ncbi:MAG: NUDIX hydrolase [Planctomycetota bacterium]|nr:NUDIX hydrolase [Planctomycetota bacterium]